MELIREFCAENMTLVPAAIAAGARRIELCDNLSVGGTSPSYGVIKAAAAFAQAAPLFFQVGDCLNARTIAEANRLGFNAAMDIGTRW